MTMASIETTATKNGERRYVVKYRDPTGKSREKWYRRKVDANSFMNGVEADKNRGEYLDPNAGRVLFSTLADRWLAIRVDKAQSTQDRDRSYLNSMILPTFGDRPIKSITPSEIEAWLASLDRAPNTRGKALQILRSILDLARRDRLIAINPAADVKPPTMKPLRMGTALSDDQINEVITAAEDIDERTAVVVVLMARCGLRIGEAFALRRRDVDLDNALLHVRTSMTRSGPVGPVKGRHREDEGRVVPIPEDVAGRLRRHFTERPITGIDNFVVTAPHGGPLRYSNWRSRVWVKITECVDFNVTPHDLRRTAATRLFVKDRWTPAEVQAFLGHRDPRITLAIYTLVEAKDLPRPSSLNTRSN
jgi:integrase